MTVADILLTQIQCRGTITNVRILQRDIDYIVNYHYLIRIIHKLENQGKLVVSRKPANGPLQITLKDSSND